MNVFVSLTDGHGLYESSLVCARSFDEKRIFESSGEVKFRSPNAVVEIHFALRNIAFPEPGKYTFQFYCNGSLLVMRPLEILKVKP
jgi:hypothetical protein